MSVKGQWQRPCDKYKFDAEHERIFGKKCVKCGVNRCQAITCKNIEPPIDK